MWPVGALLLAVLGALAVVGPAPAGAQAAPLSCPPTVADLPLSVAEPFSGTVRARAGEGGAVVERSLRCAYGEGVVPAVDLVVRWDPRARPLCATAEVERAAAIPAAPVATLVADLQGAVGGPCPVAAATGGGPSWLLPALGLALAGLVATVVVLRRRSARPPADDGEPAAAPEVEVPIDPGPEVEVPSWVGREVPAPAPVAPARPSAAPVLAALSGPGGRLAARRGPGLLVVTAALAAHQGRAAEARLGLRAAGGDPTVRVPAGRHHQDVAMAVAREVGRGRDA